MLEHRNPAFTSQQALLSLVGMGSLALVLIHRLPSSSQLNVSSPTLHAAYVMEGVFKPVYMRNGDIFGVNGQHIS